MLYTYLFLDDFVLLYPVYTLLFVGSGMSVWQISSLFAIWTVSSLVFEVPSGALADATSRRLLLVAGPLLNAVTFTMWVTAPSYWVFALGFVLWGLKGALSSGALEALVYDELVRVGATDSYAGMMGRGQAAGVVGAMLSGFVAAPVVAAGGMGLVGACSAAMCVVTAVVALLMPEHRRVGVGDEPELTWRAALASGVGEVRRSRRVRSAVVLVTVVTSVWGALDEYVPLLVSSTGPGESDVALLMVVVWAGAAAGGLLAGRVTTLPRVPFAVLLAGGAAVMALGALSGHPAGVIALGVAFGVFQLTTVVADTRLQDSITGDARATVTSLAGMSTDVATMLVYVSYAVLADAYAHSEVFVVLVVPYLVLAAGMLVRRRR